MNFKYAKCWEEEVWGAIYITGLSDLMWEVKKSFPEDVTFQ